MLIATLRVVMGAITILMYVSRAICDLIRLLITYLLSANAIAPKPKRERSTYLLRSEVVRHQWFVRLPFQPLRQLCPVA